MSDLKTPDSIIGELVDIRREAAKGVDAQHAAEVKLAEATLAAERAEALAILNSDGTAAEKAAHAKLKSEAERFARDIARAEYNRVKTKLKLLEMAQMSVQTQARLVELMYKTAGMGER